MSAHQGKRKEVNLSKVSEDTSGMLEELCDYLKRKFI